MKHIFLSADSPASLYLVPDQVADQLYEYCMEFLGDLYEYTNDRELEIIDDINTPSDQEGSVSYDETAFIYWLNHKKFPHEQSRLIRTMTWDEFENALKTKEIDQYPWFNF